MQGGLLLGPGLQRLGQAGLLLRGGGLLLGRGGQLLPRGELLLLQSATPSWPWRQLTRGLPVMHHLSLTIHGR